MTGDPQLMGSYGVDLTSDKIPIKANTRYRCTGYTKSTGPKMIVFVKGYATVSRRVEGRLETFEDPVYQMRKDIAASADWSAFQLDFEITPALLFSDFQHRVEYVRITLWAYWPAGTCCFDDLRFEQVGPLPGDQQRHAEAVTHTGEKPHLGEGARKAGAADDDEPDEQQLWLAAVNAFRAGQHANAAQLAERLLARDPESASYRLLAARAETALEHWETAERHAQWLLDNFASAAAGVEPWQRDWALVVQAQIRQHTGRSDDARAIVNQLLAAEASPHARAAAEALLEQIKQRDK
jgi:hypothetical protein